MIKRQVLLITKATLLCVHSGLQTSEARPGFDETLVYLTHTTTPNRVEKGTSKELLQWMQVYPAILQVFPFYICFLFYPVWCMQGKQFYDMVSTLNLQPPCMKTAGGLPVQFLHLKFGIWFLNLFVLNILSLIGANLLLLCAISCLSVIWH